MVYYFGIPRHEPYPVNMGASTTKFEDADVGFQFHDGDYSWRLDTMALSLTYFATGPVSVISEPFIKRVAEHAMVHGEVRFCLHYNPEALTHVMLIGQRGDRYIPPKRHPRYGKWISVLEGELLAMAFDERGVPSYAKRLGPRESVYFQAGVFHTNYVRTGPCVFYESVAGPFEREEANQDAPFAPSRDCQEAGMQFRHDALNEWLLKHDM